MQGLWLFGFFVGISGGGSSGGAGHNNGGVAGVAISGARGGLPALPGSAWGTIIVGILALAAAALVMRFLTEGALIEGVARARRHGGMTTPEGFSAGWAHWGVLVRIVLLYFAVTVASLGVLAAPCVIAVWRAGVAAGVIVLVPALLIGVPWLVTIYLMQAFASRIAVLDDRRAVDAIQKARLFLHGRLMHGLKLVVASFVGTMVIAAIGMVVIVPAAIVLAALIPVISLAPVLIAGCVLLLPAAFVLIAMIGTLRSSIWTIGYLTQVEA